MKLRVKINDNLQGESAGILQPSTRAKRPRPRQVTRAASTKKFDGDPGPGGRAISCGDLKPDTTTESRQKFGETKAPQTRRIENLPPSRPFFSRSVAFLTTLLRSEARVVFRLACASRVRWRRCRMLAFRADEHVGPGFADSCVCPSGCSAVWSSLAVLVTQMAGCREEDALVLYPEDTIFS